MSYRCQCTSTQVVSLLSCEPPDGDIDWKYPVCLFKVPMGVPQGSILGPLLFIVFVNDILSALKNCDVVMYANDTVIYFSGNSLTEIQNKLNEDLINLAHWFHSNLLTLNTIKSKSTIFGSNHSMKYRNIQDLTVCI